MTLHSLPATRFVRKTRLGPGEYRKNFHQVDREIVSAVTSPEADEVTPLMSKIYLRLVNAPDGYWEREGVLRVEAEVREGKPLKAWAVLCELLGVASATASKALGWMHEQGIIGYFAGKNGVGLRIFLNRAASSIGARGRAGGEKILDFSRGSSDEHRASRNEAAFNAPYGVSEGSDKDLNPRAPKDGADETQVYKSLPAPAARIRAANDGEGVPRPPTPQAPNAFTLEDVVTRLKAELEPTLRAAARQAAAHEHERTREWLERRGLPKAARVAQHEAYNVLRKHGVVGEPTRGGRPHADVERGYFAPAEPHPLTHEEIVDLAGACVALLETKGQSVELTLSEMSVEGGGFLLPEDVARVRGCVNSLLATGDVGGA